MMGFLKKKLNNYKEGLVFIDNLMENFAYQEHKIDIFIRNIHGKIKIMIHTSSC